MPDTQAQRVVELLRERGDRGLTPLDALELIGSFRLAARVWDARLLLRSDEEIVTETANHDGKSFARYVLRRRTPPDQTTIW